MTYQGIFVMSHRSCLPLLLIVTAGCGGDTQPVATQPSPAAESATGTVTVQFELDDDVRTVEIEQVKSGTTLEDVMRGISDPVVQVDGSGTTAFVRSIGGQATSSRQGWIFTIDEEFVPRGIGRTRLQPPTTVRWKFGGMESAATNSD